MEYKEYNMKFLQNSIGGLLIACGVALGAPALPAQAQAQPGYTATVQTFANAKSQVLDGVNKVNDGNTTDLTASIKNVVNIMLFIAGAVAVIMIIIGGIRFVVSNGDSGAVQSAKNTVLYSVIGLIVIILAYAIVNFVVTNVG